MWLRQTPHDTMERTESSPLDALISGLDDTLENGTTARAEDSDAWWQLLRPVERALSTRPDTPPELEDTLSGRIVRLVWYKLYPQRLNAPFVLMCLRDGDPRIRRTAVDVLAAALKADRNLWSDREVLRATRNALTEQRALETSHTVIFTIDQLIREFAGLTRTRQTGSRLRPLNPYVAGAVIDSPGRFYGRRQTFEEIANSLGDSGTKGVILHGARRTGKTSLLYRIRDGVLGTGFVAAYVDMQGLAGRGLDDFVRALIDAIHTAVSRVTKTAPEPTPLHEKADLFKSLHTYIQECLTQIASASLVLMFDEYELLREFITGGGTARQLESLREREPRLGFVFAGSQKVEALNDANFTVLLDSCKYVKMTFLSEEEARLLVTESSRGVLLFTEPVLDHLQALCGGHPFYIQMLCHSLFNLAVDQGTVTVGHLEQAVQTFIENPAPHLILGWNALSFQQKVVTSAIAEIQGSSRQRWVARSDISKHLQQQNFPVRVAPAEIEQALGSLRELDWLCKRPQERSFRVHLELVSRWVADHRSIWEVLEEHRRQQAECTASAVRRVSGSLIDGLLILVVAIVAGIMAKTVIWLPAAVVAYHIALIPALRGTLGMHLCRMRMVSETGARAPSRRAVVFAILRSIPLALLALSIVLLELERLELSGFMALAGVAISLIHVGKIHFGRSGRGVFDALAGVVIVRTSRGEQA